MKIIQTILGMFGYIKIPKAAVELSLLQESYFDRIYKDIPDKYEKQKLHFKRYVDAQKTLTAFLRSGRILNGE